MVQCDAVRSRLCWYKSRQRYILSAVMRCVITRQLPRNPRLSRPLQPHCCRIVIYPLSHKKNTCRIVEASVQVRCGVQPFTPIHIFRYHSETLYIKKNLPIFLSIRLLNYLHLVLLALTLKQVHFQRDFFSFFI